MSTQGQKPVARVEAHLDALREAGLDTQAFFEALVGIRDDSALTPVQRESLYQIVAMESFIWYLEALDGRPIDRIKAAQEAAKIAEEQNVVIKKRKPGDIAAELVKRDIALDANSGKNFPREEVTVRERPPKSRPKKPDALAARGPSPRRPTKKKGPKVKPGVTKFERPPPKKDD